MKASSILLLLLSTTTALAQPTPSNSNQKKVTPPTPNAASLGKFGDIPVGLNTGQANVSFPLYQIQYNDLTVPIDLTYSYSGLMVEEYPSWVGTGWTLGGTGVISRQQRGLADESAHGYNGVNMDGLKARAYIDNPNRLTHRTYLENISRGQWDSEPDIFVFNFPGFTGKFFFDETQCNTANKQAIVLSEQRLKVIGQFNYSGIYNYSPGIIERFIITDERGIIYTFDVIEKAAGAEPGDPDREDFANTWYLSSIETPNGNMVNYEYRSRVMDMPATLYERRIIPLAFFPNMAAANLHTLKYSSVAVTESVLELITFRGGSIEFIEGDMRADWDPQSWNYKRGLATERPRTLGKIRILAEGVVAKEIEFSYSYFGQDARLRLDSYRETNGTVATPPYVFDYHLGTFPKIGAENTLFQQDHWGYFTGTGETSLVPPFKDILVLLDGSTKFFEVPGNRRTPESAAKAGLLKSITYPTGGFTSFEHEPNQYFATEPGSTNVCSGTFEETQSFSASTSEGDVRDGKTFAIERKTCVKLEYSLSVPCIDGTAHITLFNGVKQVAVHSVENKMSGMFHSDMGPANGETFVLDAGVYTLSVGATNENTCGSPVTATVKMLQVQQTAGGSLNLTAGGFRVANVKDCPAEGQCRVTYYQYHDLTNPERSSGRLINEPRYQYYQNGLYDDGWESRGFASREVLCSTLEANSLVPIASAAGGVIGYKHVTVTEELQNQKGRSEYIFTSAEEYPDWGSMDFPFVPRISNEWKRGAQVSKDVFRYAGGVTERLVQQYNTYTPSSLYNRIVGVRAKPLRANNSEEYQMSVEDYDFVVYPIATGWNPLASQQDTQFDYALGVSRSITSTKTFTYDNPVHRKVTQVQTTSSEGKSLRTEMKYVEDVNSIAGLTAPEKAGIQANPDKSALIETKEYKHFDLISTTTQLYDGPELVATRVAVGTNPPDVQVNYSGYDEFGNVGKIIAITGEVTSYKWGHNGRFPILEVKNANPSDVFYTSFEEDGSPFADASGNNLAYSGARVRLLGTYNIPSSFVPSSPGNMVMSYLYWQNEKWNYSGIVPYNSTITTSGTKLDEVRVFPKGSLVMTYTYDPARGMTSAVDANSIVTHYEYDALGRLIHLRDKDTNIVKRYTYNYNSR